MNAFCAQCGTARPAEGRFCSQCGSRLHVASHPADREKPKTAHFKVCSSCGEQVRVVDPRCWKCHSREFKGSEGEAKDSGALMKAGGAALGCGMSIWISTFMILGGLALSATGIGAIVGIPLILSAILFPFISPFIGARLVRLTGPCPYCGTSVTGGMVGFNCHACKKRIVVKNNRFIRVD